MDLLSVCMVHRNVLYLCAGVRRAHTWCLWGVDLSLGSGWLWSEWRALIFKHMLLRERDCKWFMIYTVVSQLKRSTLRKDSLIPPCLCALLSSRSYMARLSSCIQPARLMSFSWLFHSFLIFSPHQTFSLPTLRACKATMVQERSVRIRCLYPCPSVPRITSHNVRWPVCTDTPLACK